jgi:hypothetical protein
MYDKTERIRKEEILTYLGTFCQYSPVEGLLKITENLKLCGLSAGTSLVVNS